MAINIDRVGPATPEVVAAFARLLPQLTQTALPLTAADIDEITSRPGSTLWLARDQHGCIVGTVTLVAFRIPSGRRARIESLVVDRDARGLGVGRALCEAALAQAAREGAELVDLTSAPHRVAANALYQRLGFQLRTSNVYRLERPTGTRAESRYP